MFGVIRLQVSHSYRPCSSVVEHSLGKGEVGSSILLMGTTPIVRTSGSNSSRLDIALTRVPVVDRAPCNDELHMPCGEPLGKYLVFPHACQSKTRAGEFGLDVTRNAEA